MKDLPIMSVSGIRGIYGVTLDELFVSRIAYIQTKLSGAGKVVIGRDTRPSGERLMRAICRGIRAAGGEPVDIGIAPTPTTCVAVSELKASAGIIITASHNPSQYNGYKMVHSSGRLFKGDECETVYSHFKRGEYPQEQELKQYDDSPAKTVDAVSIHINKIISTVDVSLIASKRMKVAVDSINGAAGAIFPALLEKLSVEWTGVHNKLDGDFVHNPEPRPEHLTDLSSLLSTSDGFWGGFIFDPDADRLATMGQNGEAVSEEMTLVLALENILEHTKSDIATNLSTSMLIDDVGAKFGVHIFRTKIGEANVVEGMKKFNCKVGGEGNGGVIYPAMSTVRDGLGAMALILELMAKRDKKLFQLTAAWPSYPIVKDKISCESLEPKQLIEKISARFPDEKKDLLDGLKIIRDYGWVHLRASNTEPIIRCYAEAKTDQQAKELSEMVLAEAKR
ncbi:phosphoglucosamine mutase [Chitinispirillales bacterium ANBcel5]|uniref:phosphoglucosamine mutase n=1 Tax=Cellulosispirillum alkaliphilum TaxID=3039283 RepID=UPI002A50A21E|nr:phosphoglucosamine mutase [Chitinispirillales bacterium ANBcel5]